MARVIVVGAGVAGLTSAVRLAEAGHRVDVVARDLPRETDVGGGRRALVPLPRASLRTGSPTWAARSYGRFAELAADPATGVRMLIRHRDLPRDHG